MEPPIVRIEDTDGAVPALALHYTRDSNSLDTVAVYATMHSLASHPGRARFDTDTQEVTPCSAAFLSTFWSSAASLLDYFADFYATDTPLMQSVWFHLLDLWQAASPVELYKSGLDFRWAMEAQLFEKDYRETLALVQRLISGSRGHTDGKSHSEALIHAPSGKVEGKAGAYETGPFVSGLKPWQQFLCAGAPGFRPTVRGNGEGTDASDEQIRYIPQPAIALLQTHTARARSLLAKASQNEGQAVAERTSAFDATALAFPSTTTRSHTHASPLTPQTLFSYHLVQGAPPVRRHEGLSDPSMLVADPDFVLLDEAVGTCKGREAYVPMTGPVGEAGVGFDVWGVRRMWGVGGGGLCGGAAGMFDEWCLEAETVRGCSGDA